MKATKRPLAEIEGKKRLLSLASSPVELTLTRVVSPSFRSRTKMSSVPLWSFGTRFGEAEKKATKRPLAESAG